MNYVININHRIITSCYRRQKHFFSQLICNKNNYKVIQNVNNKNIIPSWSDRILFRSIDNRYIIKCEDYNRYDKGNMKYSEHAGVYGLYHIKYNLS